MSKRPWIHWWLCFAVLLTSHSVLSADGTEEVKESWRTDFEGGNTNGANAPVFITGSSKEPQSDRLIFRSEEGVITLGGQFRTSGESAELAWSELKNLSLQKNPVLEIRYRIPPSESRVHIEVQPTFISAGGEKRTSYLDVHRESDQWHTKALRLAGDEPLPKEWRPQTLVGLSIRVHSVRPGEVVFDWVRLRERNTEEIRREEGWRALVRGGPPAEPEFLGEWGV